MGARGFRRLDREHPDAVGRQHGGRLERVGARTPKPPAGVAIAAATMNRRLASWSARVPVTGRAGSRTTVSWLGRELRRAAAGAGGFG